MGFFLSFNLNSPQHLPRCGSGEAAPPTAAPEVRRTRSLNACEKLHVAFRLGIQPRTSTTSWSIEDKARSRQTCEEPKPEETCAPGPPPPGKLTRLRVAKLGKNWVSVGFSATGTGNHASKPRCTWLITKIRVWFRAKRTRK